jgi:hypothetical protein
MDDLAILRTALYPVPPLHGHLAAKRVMAARGTEREISFIK